MTEITTENMTNMMKRLAMKEEVHRKLDNKIKNTEALVANYNRLLEGHRELDARYENEIERIKNLVEDGVKVEQEFFASIRAEDEFRARYDNGELSADELEARLRIRDRMAGQTEDAKTRLKQIEIAVNKIYYGR